MYLTILQAGENDFDQPCIISNIIVLNQVSVLSHFACLLYVCMLSKFFSPQIQWLAVMIRVWSDQ